MSCEMKFLRKRSTSHMNLDLTARHFHEPIQFNFTTGKFNFIRHTNSTSWLMDARTRQSGCLIFAPFSSRECYFRTEKMYVQVFWDNTVWCMLCRLYSGTCTNALLITLPSLLPLATNTSLLTNTVLSQKTCTDSSLFTGSVWISSICQLENFHHLSMSSGTQFK